MFAAVTMDPTKAENSDMIISTPSVELIPIKSACPGSSKDSENIPTNGRKTCALIKIEMANTIAPKTNPAICNR